MAARRYTVMVDIPPKKERDHKPESKKVDIDDIEWDEEYDDEDEDSSALRSVISGLVLFITTCMTIGAVVSAIAIFIFDFGHGMTNNDDLVTTIAKSLDDFSYGNISDYVPKEIRNSGFISDSDAFAQFREDDFKNEYELQSVTIENEIPYEDISVLQKGLTKVYNKQVPFTAARLNTVSLVLTDKDEHTINVTANIVTIKQHKQWYFYTGPVVSTDGEEIPFLEIQSDANDVTVSVPGNEYQVSYVEPDTAAIFDEDLKIKLDFYDGAEDDLKSGMLTIDGEEYVLPTAFEDFTDVIAVKSDKKSSLAHIILAKDETLNNVPVEFVSDEYKESLVELALGNLSNESQPYDKASMTTLYIGNTGTAPEVVLPGGVMFGTGLEDVQKMYESMHAVKDDDVFLGSLSEAVYAVDLSNKHNKIYLGFYNNKLVEVQWYYIDMNNYRDF